MRQAIEFEQNVDQQLSHWIGAIPVLIPIFQQLNVVSIINRYCPCQADIGLDLLQHCLRQTHSFRACLRS